MEQKQMTIVMEAIDIVSTVLDVQKRIKNAHGIELDFSQALEVVKTANISLTWESVSRIESSIHN